MGKYAKTWFKDWSLAGTQQGGSPPPNHPRRCQAANKYGHQCGRWALRNSDYCKKHGGAQARVKTKLSRYYTKYAGRTLSTLLKELENLPDEERLKLSEEIDVARISMAKTLSLFNVLLEDDFRDKDGNKVNLDSEKRANLFASFAKLTQDGLSHVASLVTSMAKVDALRADKTSIQNIKWIIDRVIRIVDEEVRPVNRPAADAAIKKISEIKLLEGECNNPRVVLSIV